MASSVCRVCLAGNIKMLNIDNEHLLQMFAKLTDSKLNIESEAGIPSTVCYICHRQLQKCHMFSELARSSEQTMRELLHNNIQITYSTITMLSPAVPTLSITSTQNMSIINHITATSAVFGTKEKYIKLEEPLNESQILDFTSATVKEEQVTINIELEEEAGFESLPTSWNTVEEEKKDLEIEESVCESLPTSWNTVEEEKKDMEIEESICESLPTSWTIIEEEKKDMEIEESICESLPTSLAIIEEEKKCESLPTSLAIIEEEKKDSEIDWATVEEEKKDLVIEDTELIYNKSLVTSENAATIDPKEQNIENVTNIKHQPIDSYLYCDICNRKFEFEYQRVKHLKYCKQIKKTHTCTICGRVYSSHNYLTIHMRTHTGDKPFSCSECDKKFIGKNHLRRHVKLHMEGTSNCNVCDETFNCKSEFVKHMASHTVMTHPCNQCEKTFNNQWDYMSHIQIHSLEKFVNTEQSQERAVNTEQINKKEFMCHICNKTLTRNSNLKKHMRLHFSMQIPSKEMSVNERKITAKKLFECETCNKSFTRNRTLKKHMRIHFPFQINSKEKSVNEQKITAKKLFACHTCNKSFTRNRTLKIHNMRIHFGDK